MIAVCLAGAPIIQLFDMQLLREQIIASIADGPCAEEFEPGQFARLTTGARHGDPGAQSVGNGLCPTLSHALVPRCLRALRPVRQLARRFFRSRWR